MLLHLVSFKYKAEVDAAARAQHRQRLAGLKDLDGVIDLKVGEDVVRSPRSTRIRRTNATCRSRGSASVSASRSSRSISRFSTVRSLRFRTSNL